ncbi:transposase [Acidaminobacter hydrogenoformans]|uniref:Transposase domain n=1 Tax=Acidaminobacter hydrogenoformans DSM 2784 TaxID=1120920 RepID=A0A1G5RSC7_9FIRM|nr:transposase [Acidaminobacter hydrogenoformans]SCZ76341.1 Transposase domain [Acidaminobacter hydrogenoformans DSM 2784]
MLKEVKTIENTDFKAAFDGIILKNPYLQYFLGFDSFEDDRPPFDASLITHFRKRFTPDILLEINNIIAIKELEAAAASEKRDDDDHHYTNGFGPSEPTTKDVQISFDDIPKQGKLILDATCAPSDIRFPTDLRLLKEALEKLEDMIDALHAPDISVAAKHRTYHNRARKDYLSNEKQRKTCMIRKRILCTTGSDAILRLCWQIPFIKIAKTWLL